MKKTFFSKILSTILVVSLLVSVLMPIGAITGMAVDIEPDYSSAFNNVDAIRADGWKGFFSSDPQGGVAFSEIADSDYGKYYETWGGNVITRSQTPSLYNSFNNWNNKSTFTNMGALTYTAKKYKYFSLTLEYKFAASGNPWPLVTFNQQSTTPEMFYRPSDYIENPTYSEDPIAVSPNYVGTIRVFGKKASDSKTKSPQMDSDSSPQWHKMQIVVTEGEIYTVIYDKDGKLALELTTALDESYKGGYITLMQNGVSHFKNITIADLSDVDFTGDYSSSLDVSGLDADGWVAAYSSDPQGGVEFTDKSSVKDLFESWGSGNITRRQGQKEAINSSNQWNTTPFTNMGALTYTAQKYKYFLLTVEYKFSGSGNPWPVVTFNQPNTTPEMFYRVGGTVTEPSYSEDPIAVSPNYAGSIRVFGKKAEDSKTMSPQLDADSSPQWHKMQIKVTPGSIYTAIYDKDGKLALELTTDLDESYQGGYISLMLNGISFFKNLSITEFPEVSINNYYGTPDGNGGIADDKVVLERTFGKGVKYGAIVPERAGYSFMGFYNDAEYSDAIDLESAVNREATVYAKWSDFADITADGSVNILDLIRIKKMAAGATDTAIVADLDFNGISAQAADLTVLGKVLLGIDVLGTATTAAELVNDGMLYTVGRAAVVDDSVEMSHVNSGFFLEA